MFDYVINELSLQPYPDKVVAYQNLDKFVNLCIAAQKQGFSELKLPEHIGENLYAFEIAENYTIGSLTNEHRNEPIVERFKLLVTNAPYLQKEQTEEQEEFDYSEYFLTIYDKRVQVYGLGVAHLLDTLAVSFRDADEDSSIWDRAVIPLDRTYISVDETGDSVETKEKAEVRHASLEAHIEFHKKWLEDKKKEIADTCEIIWNKRKELFPDLIFCGKTEQQLKAGNLTGISRIYQKLVRLNAYAEKWESGGFSTDDVADFGVKVSSESETVRNNKVFSKHRIFRLPPTEEEPQKREKRFFGAHVKTGDIRFHFYADDTTRKVYIGYIGKHLPTKKYPK